MDFGGFVFDGHGLVAAGGDSGFAAGRGRDGARIRRSPSEKRAAPVPVKEDAKMITNRMRNAPEMPAQQTPIGPRHIDSDVCWCEPIVDMDEDGEAVVVHREITWN
jgi:hypothetical protein